MRNIKTRVALTEPVTRETLDQTPVRALALLRTIGTIPVVRHAMESRGYTDAVHREGWALLHAASGYGGASLQASLDGAVRDALVSLDNQDEDIFRTVKAGLKNRHPDQAKYVLEGIGPTTGAAVVVNVKILLERFDTLETGKERKATRTADHAAMATLAARGITTAKRKELAALVAKAEQPADTSDLASEEASAAQEQEHVAALTALRVWYEEWSEIAKVAVKRRDHLIRLGLSKRKSAPKKANGAGANASGGSAGASGVANGAAGALPKPAGAVG
jgi:hypothetical protein